MKRHYLRMVRRALRTLRHPRLRNREWWRRMSAPLRNRSFWVPCRDSVAVGMATGLFFANMPMPFQMLPAALAAAMLRGNVPTAMAACWVSNPVTQVPFMLLQYKVGQWLCDTLHIGPPEFLAGASVTLPALGALNLTTFVLGVAVCGTIMAAAAFPLTHFFSWLMPHHLPSIRRRKQASTTDASPPLPAATGNPPPAKAKKSLLDPQG